MSKTIAVILTIILIDFSFCSRFYNLPKISSKATWHKDGEPLSLSGIIVIHSFPLSSIFVDVNNIVYICCSQTQLLFINWYTVFSTVDASVSRYLALPYSLFVTSNGDIYIDNGVDQYIKKLTSNGGEDSIELPGKQPCYDMFVDINNTLYCSVKDGHRVIKQLLESSADKTWATVAGADDKPGSAANMLDEPFGIFVDTDFNLYVADCNNNRVQVFTSGQQNEISAINASTQIDGYTLACPTDVVLDADRNLYIVDCNNHRVVFVTSDFSRYRCLVGCFRRNGRKVDELNFPMSISFDNSGRLFITDTKNNRIQIFSIASNDYDETTTTITKTKEPTTTTTIPETKTAEPSTTTRMSETTTTTTKRIPETKTTTRTTIKSTLGSENMSSTTLSSSSTTKYLTTSNYVATISSTTDNTNTTDIPTSLSSFGSTTTQSTTANLKPTTEIIASTDGALPPPFFVPRNCSNSSYIGSACNVSMKPCDALKPCKNSGNCTNDPKRPYGYHCTCEPDFSGTDCESEIGPCKLNTCLYNGICIPLNKTNFQCNCTRERTGTHCDLLIDYCQNVTCLNKGLCRALSLDYKCECLTAGYSGRHCEHVARSIIIRQYVSKAFGYIAIIALSLVAGFVIIMDILKYVFGIDPVHGERELLRRRRAALRRKNREPQKPQNTLHLRRTNKVSPKQINPNTKDTIARKH